MSELVSKTGLKSALSQFLKNLASWLPVKGFSNNGKSQADTLMVQNEGEVAMGTYNSSNSDTIMSVGNGNASKRQNAFEIKKDGGIYITKENNQIKLQDALANDEAIPVEVVEKLN